MFQEPVARFTRDAEKLASDKDGDARPPERQRGMWSFLTWSFFLAQALAANEVFAKGIMLGQDDANAGAMLGGDDAGKTGGNANGPISGTSTSDYDAAAAAKFTAAMAALGLNPLVWSAIASDPSMIKNLMDALTAEGGVHGAAGDGSFTAEAAGTDPSGDGSSGDPSAHDPGLGGIIQIPLEVIDHLGMTIEDIVLHDVLDPVVTAVGDVLGSTINGVSTFVGSTLHAVPDLLNDAIHINVTGVLENVGSLVNNAVPLVNVATGTVEHLVSTAGDVIGDVVASSSNLLQSTVGAVVTLADGALSSVGPYNPYDQTMQGGQSHSAMDDTGSAHTASSSALADIDVVHTLDDTLNKAVHSLTDALHIG